MGIKGIYQEIGPGRRVSLCKLAVDHLKNTGQPLRVAIDFAIWSFQAQAARGGANPAIRTLFYRLVRLLSLTIVPIFVFDGPHKPAFKRGKRSRGPGDTVSVAMAKRLFQLFGFAVHDAPGEAEAECALLQQQGVVDAVLSEDVDTIMFGCTRTLRNWSAAGARGAAAKAPTHVSVYDAAALRQAETGLDREGMVLVALMSGGDYVPDGVPGCGVKIACEAARAGFGRRLCRIKRSEPEALREWREELTRELWTNESKFFRSKHTALRIPEDFPNIEVLRYYTHPVVSQAATVERLRREFPSKQDIDIIGLREFTAETFDWRFKTGAVKFIRVFAAGLLIQGLMDLSRKELESNEPETRETVESKLVKSIKSTRIHFSTDATPELRMSFIPVNIVGVDLDAEEEEVTATYGRSGIALNSDDEGEEQLDEEEAENGRKKVFDPLQPDFAWVPETVAKLGVPLMVENWEAKQRNKQLGKAKKAPAKRSRKKASDMLVGALDKYVKSSKLSSTALLKELEKPTCLPSASRPAPSQSQWSSQHVRAKSTVLAAQDPDRGATEFTGRKQSLARHGKAKAPAPAPRPSLDVNPWSIAGSQSTPKAIRTRSNYEVILIPSSPAGPSPPPATVPVAVDAVVVLGSQSSTLQLADDSPQMLFPSDGPCSPSSSPAPAKSSADATLSPRKHGRPSGVMPAKPAAKRSQRPKATRHASPTRNPACATHAATRTAAQPSIQRFGRLGKNGAAAPAAPAAKRPSPRFGIAPGSPASASAADSDAREDDLGKNPGPRKKPPPPPPPPPPPIAIPSSPRAASPPAPSVAMTRLYIPRTSDAGRGYVREVEVTRDEADRMMRDAAAAGGARGPAGRAGARRRMWRESEASIVDLTGVD